MQTAGLEPALERVVFTIKEFCRRNGISVPTYGELRARGRGAKEMRIGTKVLITLSAEAEWQRARENPVGKEAEEIARTAKALQERGRKAAKKAVASPRHVSHRPIRRGCRAYGA
jgi:hypothetical protein